MVELGAFVLDLMVNLLADAISQGVRLDDVEFFRRRRIKRRIEDAVAEVVEPLLPLLVREGVPEEKQRRLIETCVQELRPLLESPEPLFQGSLDGQKLFQDLYLQRGLPQTVVEDGLRDVYALLFPRIATLLCRIPAAVRDWEYEAWSENYTRLDEIAQQMRALFERVDDVGMQASRDADATFTLVRQLLAQKLGFELDLTGLRADRPLSGRFDDFFVHPDIRQLELTANRTIVGSADDALRRFTCRGCRAVIIGAPGAGKSTWAKWLQREVLHGQWEGIAVRFELRRYAGSALPSIHDLIKELAGAHLAEELDATCIRRWMADDRVVVILDGFDEIAPIERDRVHQWILELSPVVRGSSVILTSRPLTTDHLGRLGNKWRRWTIQPFDEERIVDYIGRWYQHTPLLADSDRSIDVTALASGWLSDPTIGPLTGSPLLLSTLLMVHHLDGSLPSGRSGLYRRYVEGMLGLWDDRRRVPATSVTLSLECKRHIIRGLALEMFLRQEDQLDEPVVIEILSGLLREAGISLAADEVLAVLRERTGLIVGPGVYSFMHKTVAEYLVAEAIHHGSQRTPSGDRIDRWFLLEQRNDDRWSTVTFLWAGLVPIGELESFIDGCSDRACYDLAYGLIYDQYDRIPMPSRRKLLLALVTKKAALPEPELEAYFVSSAPGQQAFLVPLTLYRIRSVTEGADLGNLLHRAADDQVLHWTDVRDLRGELRDLLWLTFAMASQTLEGVCTMLSAPCPATAPQANWLMLAVHTGLRRALNKREDTPGAMVEALLAANPAVKGILPLALAALLVETLLVGGPSTAAIASSLVEALGCCDADVVDEAWLLGTLGWLLGTEYWIINLETWTESNLVERADLLHLTAIEIHRLKREPITAANAAYDNALNLLARLQQRRAALQRVNAMGAVK